MKLPSLPSLVFYVAAPLLLSACEKPEQAHTTNNTNHARNVILIIGDGMDDQQITMARNYFKGAQGKLTLDTLPIRSTVQVLTVLDEDPTTVVYVADSANSASAMATGIITSRGRIATSANTDCDATTIIELAQAAHLKTGIVSTASITDATPSAFIAHVSNRSCENPTMMKDALAFGTVLVDCNADLKVNGGLGSISEQIVDSNVDVVLGGGNKHFQHMAERREMGLIQAAKDNGFDVIYNVSQLGNTPRQKKLLGLFSPSHIPVRLRGENGRIAEKPIATATGVQLPDVMSCEANPQFAGMPSLKQMTDAALAHLGNNNNTGFFLTIESASIDKQSHGRNTCGHIGELQQLEESLQSALAFAEHNPNTLILVTADHGQAAQIIPDRSLFLGAKIPVYTPGHLTRLKTSEGQIMAVNYATNDFYYEEHTGVNIPLFSNGVGKGLIPPMLTQPEIFNIMTEYLGLPSTASVSCATPT